MAWCTEKRWPQYEAIDTDLVLLFDHKRERGNKEENKWRRRNNKIK